MEDRVDVSQLPPKDPPLAEQDNFFSQFHVELDTTPKATVSEVLIEDPKNPFTDVQNKAAAFAYRQKIAIEQTDNLIEAGYNPSTDYFNYLVSFAPDILEGIITTPHYKQWQRARIDLSTAQLRPETGAVINESEIYWIDDTMWDKLGDDPVTRQRKRDARSRAYLGNKAVAGKAYDRLVKEMEAGEREKTQTDVYSILKPKYDAGQLSETQAKRFEELMRLMGK